MKKIIDFILRVLIYINRQIARADWDLSDIYIVSYPKSGTTWTCLLIASVLKQLNNDHRRVDFFTVHDYVPDMHANPQRITQLPPPRFIKTHENFSQWYKRIYIKGRGIQFPRVIYLLRDGCDTMASAYHYSKALTGKSYNFSQFINNEKKFRGEWSGHVNDWILRNEILDKRELLLIKYEDLRDDPISEVQKIMDFAGIHVNNKIIEYAVKESDIGNVRSYESIFGGGVKYKNPEYRFARKGQKRPVDKELTISLDEYYKNNIDVFKQAGYSR